MSKEGHTPAVTSPSGGRGLAGEGPKVPKPTPSGNSEAIAKLEAARRRIDEQIAEQQLAAQFEAAEEQARAAWVEMSGEKEKVDSPEQSPHWGDDSKIAWRPPGRQPGSSIEPV